MRTTITALVLVTLVALSGSARAQEGTAADGHGVGVGAERTLGGVTGATFVYDNGRLTVTGLFGFVNVSIPGDDFTAFALGARIGFNVHRAAQADFSLGGGLTLVNAEVAGDSEANLHLEGVAQIRAFLNPNVALSAQLGLAIIVVDEFLVASDLGGASPSDDQIRLTGQIAGGFGITYFFK